jgi:hypothetical protein
MRQEFSEKAGTSDLLFFEVPVGRLAAAKNRKDEMKKDVQVSFEIEIEEKDRYAFQAEGHMLFALTSPGDTPDAPLIRRPWGGNKVFIGVIQGPKPLKLRVMSDSQEDCLRLMQESILDTLWARVREDDGRTFNYQQFLANNQERNEMAEFFQKFHAGAWAAWLQKQK